MANPFESAIQASAQMSVAAASKITGMAPDQVAGILADGLPKAMEAARSTPESAVAAVQQALEAAPEPLHDVYARMGATAASVGASEADFLRMFGSQAKALEEAAAAVAGTTTEKVGAVLGATVPAVKDAMRQGASVAGQAVEAVDPARAQEVLDQMAQASRAVFGRLSGRG